MGDQNLEAGFSQLGSALETTDEGPVRSLRDAAARHHGGVARGVDHHHKPKHPQEFLVGLGPKLLDQVEHRLHLGVLFEQFVECVGGVGDGLEALHDLGRRAAVVLVAEHLLHVAREPLFQEPMLAVAVAADLVHEDPAEILVELGGVGIERDALRPQEFDPPAHPAPAIPRLLGHHRDIVGHVDRLKAPDVHEVGLQGGDPLGERLGLEVLTLGLQFVRPDPEDVGRQSAERAKRGGRQRHMRRHPLRALDRHHQLQVVPLPADRLEQEAGGHKAGENDPAAGSLDDPVAAADRLCGRGSGRVVRAMAMERPASR